MIIISCSKNVSSNPFSLSCCSGLGLIRKFFHSVVFYFVALNLFSSFLA